MWTCGHVVDIALFVKYHVIMIFIALMRRGDTMLYLIVIGLGIGIYILKGFFINPYPLWDRNEVRMFRGMIGDKYAKLLYGFAMVVCFAIAVMGLAGTLFDDLQIFGIPIK